MFTFTFQDVPTNHNRPYTEQYPTIKAGLDSKIYGKQLVSIVDSNDAVHYGVITKEGELRKTATYELIKHGMTLHQSEEYIAATKIKIVAKLA